MTDTDKLMNPQHFGSDPVDNRLQIYPEIRIPDHFWFRFCLGGGLRYSSSSSEGQGLFSPGRQWVYRPSPERVLLVILGTEHLALRLETNSFNSTKAHQEGSFNEVPLWSPSF